MKKAINNIIVNQSGKILIIKRVTRKERAYPGLWDLPGGGVEEGETLQKAATREAIEETGLDIKPEKKYFYVYYYNDKDLYVYGFISRTENTKVILCKEHVEFKWISKAEYKNFEYTPSVGATVKEFFSYGNLKIKKFREEIDKVDSGLIKIIAKRFKVTEKIRVLKSKINLPVEDKNRESEIMEKADKLATKLKINSRLVRNILTSIIKEAKKQK